VLATWYGPAVTFRRPAGARCPGGANGCAPLTAYGTLEFPSTKRPRFGGRCYADPEDLALIKEAAARRGIPEAEILREAVKLPALGAGMWDEPLLADDETLDLGGPISTDDIREARAHAAQTKTQRVKARR
jgi:hypothetical protein